MLQRPDVIERYIAVDDSAGTAPIEVTTSGGDRHGPGVMVAGLLL
jgi:hypothetical protein